MFEDSDAVKSKLTPFETIPIEDPWRAESMKAKALVSNFSLDVELFERMEAYIEERNNYCKKAMKDYMKSLAEYEQDQAKPKLLRKGIKKPTAPPTRYTRAQFLEECIRMKLDSIELERGEKQCQ